MIRILIADDHAIVRQGLKQVIADQNDMQLAGEASNGNEVLAFLEKHKVDVVVLDVTMPGRNGIEVLKDIHQRYPTLPVLVLSMHPEDQYALRALRAGASGYITKESAPTELVSAIRKVMRGRKYISESVADSMLGEISSERTKEPHELLSDREFEVLRMIASGKSLTEIAAELSLSIKTISTYRGRILDKMRLKNNAELTHYAISNKLIQ
ncbi:MAG: response regulator transcription factor [Ignavibacteriae bacterium]|nr:response regulator transcription factor [Ignavibacteriota bacterium]